MTLTTHLHLAPKLKKELSYTSVPNLSLYGSYRVRFTFTEVFVLTHEGAGTFSVKQMALRVGLFRSFDAFICRGFPIELSKCVF